MSGMVRQLALGLAIASILAAICDFHPAQGDIDTCPTAEEAVFPYWSTCYEPAVYAYSGGAYKIQSLQFGAVNGSYLAPERDERNSTSYRVRVVSDASDAATYQLTHLTEELRLYVAVSHSRIIIQNVESGRALGWRRADEEGRQSVLVETDDFSSSSAWFKFSPADDAVSASLPCPRIANARCAAYTIVSSDTPSLGLATYEQEDGAVYFTLAADDLNPFTLISTQATTTPPDNTLAAHPSLI